jgi:hypothetical protein
MTPRPQKEKAKQAPNAVAHRWSKDSTTSCQLPLRLKRNAPDAMSARMRREEIPAFSESADRNASICPTAKSVDLLALPATVQGPSPRKTLRQKLDFSNTLSVFRRFKPSRQKYSSSIFQKYMFLSRHPASMRGAYASSRTWGGDAMDACGAA